MMIYGWREREICLDFFEKRHRAADEPQLHPPRRRCGRPARRLGRRHRTLIPAGLARASTSTRNCSTRTRSSSTGPRVSASSPLRSAGRIGVTGPIARASASIGICARSSPTRASSSTSSTSPLGKHGDVFDRYLVRMEEMQAVAADRRPGARDHARWRLPHRGPQGDAAAAQAHRRVDGSAHPPLQDLHRGLQGPGR